MYLCIYCWSWRSINKYYILNCHHDVRMSRPRTRTSTVKECLKSSFGAEIVKMSSEHLCMQRGVIIDTDGKSPALKSMEGKGYLQEKITTGEIKRTRRRPLKTGWVNSFRISKYTVPNGAPWSSEKNIPFPLTPVHRRFD